MPAISVKQLNKTFLARRKQAGLRGSLRALIKPDYRTVEAVQDISLEMDGGEILGFIGPNGAGKSTTIKILTGILFPTRGEVNVLGFVPWKQRRQLAYHLGTVFGQRPQLWYHLPAVDTFQLFGNIFELDDKEVGRRIAYLTEMFGIQDLLETPVRKLSLGERMRCEVAAALIHKPKLLLLDEPSIGLDVVAKQMIRDTITTMNQEEGVGVLLTSHDAGDIEAICKRVIIVNHGRIIYQDKVSTLKRRYLTTKTVGVRYADKIPGGFQILGAEILKIGSYGVKLRFDSSATSVESIITQVAKSGNLVDITVSDPSLEEVIRKIYQEEYSARPA